VKEYGLHPEAEADLDAIWESIAEDSLEAADRVVDSIEAAIHAVVAFPHQGHRRPDLTARRLRFTNSGNYLIAYAPDTRRCGWSRLCMGAAVHGSWPQF